ncbi:dynamin family protein [Siminovitchia sediminis]|uniref:Dynamin family protein n=1 Tax=Siminovitchia sediminis TaxID=1274353 RepID=A0ABW4KJJ8_9BACI
MISNQVKEPSSAPSGMDLYQSIFRKIKDIREDEQEEVTKRQLKFYRSQVDLFRQSLMNSHNGQNNKTGRLLYLLEDYNTKVESLVQGLDESFMLFVVGSGKYGKSTLINALLETKAAEVGILPKTWKIDVFRNDQPVHQVIIKYRDSREEKVSAKRAQEIIKGEEKKRKESEAHIRNEIKEYKKKNPTLKAMNEFKLKLEREELYHSDITEIHWGVSGAPILEYFHVVDTPGLKQNIMGDIRHNVQDFYHKADGVLWMLDATSISASNAKKLIKELEESIENIGGKHHQNIIAVLNRIDLVYKNQGEEGVKKVLADAQSIYKGYFRAIVPLSAKMAYDGAAAGNKEFIEKSGLNELYAEIQNAFFKNAKRIQCDKKLESGRAYNKEVLLYTQQYLLDLAADLEKMNDGFEKVDEQLDVESNKFFDYAKAQLDSYENRVKENIALSMDSFMNIKGSEQQKSYLEDHIFELPRLTHMFEQLQKEQKDIFEGIEDYYVKKIYFTEYPSLMQQHSLELRKDMDVQVNIRRDLSGEDFLTYGSGIAAGAVGALILGPVGLLVGGIVGWFAKKSIKDELRRKLIKEVDTIISGQTEKMMENIESHADHVYERIQSSANQSFTQVYSFGALMDHLDDFKEVEDMLDHGERLKETLSNPTPNFYTPLKEILMNK